MVKTRLIKLRTLTDKHELDFGVEVGSLCYRPEIGQDLAHLSLRYFEGDRSHRVATHFQLSQFGAVGKLRILCM